MQILNANPDEAEAVTIFHACFPKSQISNEGVKQIRDITEHSRSKTTPVPGTSW